MKYRWIAKSDDGAFEDESALVFDTKRECYDDMRDAVLQKMKWNTEYDNDFEFEDDYIGYKVLFGQNKITHHSYSGLYTYEIVEVKEELKCYTVSMPFMGSISVDVMASDEEEALRIGESKLNDMPAEEVINCADWGNAEVE